MINKKIVEIANNIYWIGEKEQQGGLHCNPYLIVDNDEAVLIDPGSVLDFEYVYDNLISIIPLEKLKYVVLHHQDPDLCASVPLFEAKGANFKIVTHWRTKSLVKYYGIKSEYYIVNNHKFSLKLNSGRELKFLQTPYLHFAGSIVTYDPESKILFSSDLFGAFSQDNSIYAGDDYVERMKAFHEHYMPLNEIVKPIMEMLLAMDISIIAPQHGCIITYNIAKHIKILRDLECGSFLKPIKSNLKEAGGYKILCSKILQRYKSLFSKDEVDKIIKGLKITVDDKFNVINYNYNGDELWEMIFDKVFLEKGMEWLLVIEPYVHKLSNEYDVKIPKIFEANLKKAEENSVNLIKENKALKDINKNLEIRVEETYQKVIKSSITGLYNYKFFKEYLLNEIKHIKNDKYKQNPSLLIISVDNLNKIRYAYGDSEVDNIFRNVVYVFEDLISKNEMYFKLQGALFACYIPFSTKEIAIKYAEKIRNNILNSNSFIEKITVSIGLASFNEVNNNLNEIETYDALYYLAMARLKTAINKGMNYVCSKSSLQNEQNFGSILVIDSDKVNLDVLKTVLENENYKVFVANDGDMAIEVATKNKLDLIISAIMIPKTDGFLVREKLLANSYLKNIPYIIVSYVKNENTVQRAFNLGIEYYLKKPYLLNELIGIVKILTKRGLND